MVTEPAEPTPEEIAEARRLFPRSGAFGYVATELGHTDLRVFEKKPGRWVGACSCGYTTTNRQTSRDATGGLVHHIELIEKPIRDRARLSGRDIDELIAAARRNSKNSVERPSGNVVPMRLHRPQQVEPLPHGRPGRGR